MFSNYLLLYYTVYMRTLRIVFDASPLLVNKTGIAYYTERLVTALADTYPDEIELVGFYYNFLGRRPVSHLPKRKNLRFKSVTYVPSKIIFQLRRWGIEFPIEYLAKTSADFVLYPNFLSYPSLRHTPSAPVIHDLTFLDLPEYVSRKNQQDLERFVPKAIERSTFVATVSEFTKQKIHQQYGVPANNILVTPIPPDVPQIFPESRRTAMRKKYGINKPYLLFVGTIEPRKNVKNLLGAYTQLPEEIRNNYSLIIAGRPGWGHEDTMATLLDLQAQGSGVTYMGYVSEVERAMLYQGATLFVTASNYEGFGMPILEAMSYGTPVAASDIPVFHEVAGESAHYFDQTKPHAIALALERLLANPRALHELGKSGKKRAASFNWEATAAQLYAKIRDSVRS